MYVCTSELHVCRTVLVGNRTCELGEISTVGLTYHHRLRSKLSGVWRPGCQSIAATAILAIVPLVGIITADSHLRQFLNTLT